ncbi:MAG: hypothetical protein DRP99_07140, partial [Candidatus Latescibacterota bacterium]
MDKLGEWTALLREQGQGEAADEVLRKLEELEEEARSLAQGWAYRGGETDDLEEIRRLRPEPFTLPEWDPSEDELSDRLLGALLGRAAGCVLGVPCEGMTKDEIESACRSMGVPFPLRDYWPEDPAPCRFGRPQYGTTPRRRFLRPYMRYAGADDDLAYTVLGLLILEDYGPDFSSEDVADAWLRYLPFACTAEAVALENLRRGLKPPESAREGNPYVHWIGASIRADPWGYVAAGDPELAAELAHRDAVVSHRGVGVHGEMFFAAAVAAAFVADDVEEALEAGLAQIPEGCWLSRAVRRTMGWAREDGDWTRTVERIYREFGDLSSVHTVGNAA